MKFNPLFAATGLAPIVLALAAAVSATPASATPIQYDLTGTASYFAGSGETGGTYDLTFTGDTNNISPAGAPAGTEVTLSKLTESVLFTPFAPSVPSFSGVVATPTSFVFDPTPTLDLLFGFDSAFNTIFTLEGSGLDSFVLGATPFTQSFPIGGTEAAIPSDFTSVVGGQVFDIEVLTSPVTLTASIPVSSATPEPAVWAMMLAGFGGLGAAMRSRRKMSAATTA